MARKRKPKPKTDNRNGQALTATTEPDTTPTKATTSSSTKLKSGSSSSSSAAAVSTSSNNFIDDLLPAEPGMKHLSTVRVLVVGATLLSIGTAGFYHLPGLMQSKQDGDDEDGDDSHRLVNAFYCATMTLTTVGFGDICPADTNAQGKMFLLAFVVASLGFFCGPVLQLGASWRHAIPGGVATVGSVVLGLGVTVFGMAEGLDQFDALYAAIITGTTIGYGDVTPKTDAGKIAVALYAIVSLQAMGMLLDPARTWLEQLCRRAPPQPLKKPKTKSSVKQD